MYCYNLRNKVVWNFTFFVHFILCNSEEIWQSYSIFFQILLSQCLKQMQTSSPHVQWSYLYILMFHNTTKGWCAPRIVVHFPPQTLIPKRETSLFLQSSEVRRDSFIIPGIKEFFSALTQNLAFFLRKLMAHFPTQNGSQPLLGSKLN